jgi:hypothetical protein
MRHTMGQDQSLRQEKCAMKNFRDLKVWEKAHELALELLLPDS